MKKLNFSPFSIWVFLFLLGNANAQGVYKWTDKDGKVHYGDPQSAKVGSTEIEAKKVTTTPKAELRPNSPISPIAPRININARSSADEIERANKEMSQYGKELDKFQRDNAQRAAKMPEITRIKPVPFVPPPKIQTEPLPDLPFEIPESTLNTKIIMPMGIPAIKQCYRITRDQHNTQDSSESKKLHEEYMAQCANILIECEQFRKHPKDSKCIALPRKEKDPIFHRTIKD